jgi:hypothetical protein
LSRVLSKWQARIVVVRLKEADVSQYNNYILHNSLNTMLKKSSVSMIVLLVVVAASLIGISSIHQYVEGQGPSGATAQSQRQLG